jgi:hypothetical protein
MRCPILHAGLLIPQARMHGASIVIDTACAVHWVNWIPRRRITSVLYLFYVIKHPVPSLTSIRYHTVKGARGKLWDDSLNIKYASKLSCYASPEAYLSHLTSKTTNALFNFLSDKYVSGEATPDNLEAYLSFCESNDTLPHAPFTVHELSRPLCWYSTLYLFMKPLYRYFTYLRMNFYLGQIWEGANWVTASMMAKF